MLFFTLAFELYFNILGGFIMVDGKVTVDMGPDKINVGGSVSGETDSGTGWKAGSSVDSWRKLRC